jgi:DNA-binding transcriptional LysR family regulator
MGRHPARTGLAALEELGRRPLVLTPPGTSSRRVVEAALEQLGIEPTVAVEVAQREAVVPLVLAGAGIGFVPGAQADSARAQGARIVRLEPPLVRHIGLLHRPGPMSPAARGFCALAQTPRSPDQPKRPVM